MTVLTGGMPPVPLVQGLRSACSWILGHSHLWPIGEANVADWTDDQLFDMVEFLNDQVSKGNTETGYFHNFNECGWHFSDFRTEPAQSSFVSV